MDRVGGTERYRRAAIRLRSRRHQGIEVGDRPGTDVHVIGAGLEVLYDVVTGCGAENEGIAAGPADQRIVASPTVDVVRELVSSELQAGRSGGQQILDFLPGAQLVVHRGVDGIHPFSGLLNDLVVDIVDTVDVVAFTPLHEVGAR